MLFLRTEPPIDEITQLGVAQLMTTGIAAKADAAESQARQRGRGLLDQRDGSDRVLVAGREPCRNASRADSTGKDPPCSTAVCVKQDDCWRCMARCSRHRSNRR